MSEFPRHPTRRQRERSEGIRGVVSGIVDMRTAWEGRQDDEPEVIAFIGSPTPVEGAVMGFDSVGNYDIQYQPQLPIMDVVDVPLVPQEFDWEQYLKGMQG